jgi:hypothetical protein
MNEGSAAEGGTGGAGAAPPVIDSRSAYRAALRWGFAAAIGRGARVITCVDPDFAEWPLSDPELLAQLTSWLRLPQRGLVLLAASYDEVPRRHPRFTAWRRDWAHVLQAWQAPAEMAGDLPSVLLDDRSVNVQLIDATHWRGRAQLDLRSTHLWHERIDVVLQRAERAFAVNTLGL